MQCRLHFSSGGKIAFFLSAVFALALLFPAAIDAQAPPIPAEFQDLYTSLNTYLSNFNKTLQPGAGSPYSGLSAGNLENANANAGPALVNQATSPGILLQVQQIKAMGAKAVMLQVGFPMLYEPFLTSQGQSQAQFVAFYQQVAATVRAAGLKLIVENDTLLTNDIQAGWNMAPFYAALDWNQYQQARAQNAVTVAQTLQPDFLVVVEEPNTEAANSGQSQANTASGSSALLSQILTGVHQAGVSGMLVGAGVDTAQQNFLSFIQGYVALPVDFIDMHIYPVNRAYLPNALQIASTAAAAGKPVTMSEGWLWKVRDNELSKMSPGDIRGRNPFDFWAPLDTYYLQTMENLAQYTKMLFMAPMGPDYYGAYLPYDSSTEDLPSSQILAQESAQASQNLHGAVYTSTAAGFHNMIVWPPDKMAPAVPAGLTGASANPTTAYLTWSASTDDVGVAGYYVLRNGVPVDTTADLYYQDTGLTESATYTYTVEAFDLAGNVSAPSLSVAVTTEDATPPSVPAYVAAVANSVQKVTVTWSASADKQGISYYAIYSGISAKALVQVGRALSPSTLFTSYPLTAGTTYYYAVQAVDPAGNTSALSAIVPVTTPLPPAAPGGLSVTPLSAAKLAMAWSVPASGGLPIQNYHVFRGSSANALIPLAIVTQPSYTDTTVTSGAVYYYGVEAADTGSRSVRHVGSGPSYGPACPIRAWQPDGDTGFQRQDWIILVGVRRRGSSDPVLSRVARQFRG